MMPKTKLTIEDKLADPTLDIDADTVFFSRELIDTYKTAIALFQAKADDAANPQQQGGYRSHKNRNEQNRDRMEANLAFQLEWLRRHRPAIYDEVTK